MYSLEKLKELAVNQMRAAADLYGICEEAEQVAEMNDDQYIKAYLRFQRNERYNMLEHRFRLKPTEEEKDLWDEAMIELD